MLTTRDAARAGAAVLATAAAFQVALSAGMPWGAAAWGGRYPGRLPTGLRAASAGAALALGSGAAIAVVPGLVDPGVRLRVLQGAAAYLAAGTVLNAVSPSPVERLWSPVNAAGAWLLWQAATGDDAGDPNPAA